MTKILIFLGTVALSVGLSCFLVFSLPGHFHQDEVQIQHGQKSLKWTESWEHPEQSFSSILKESFFATLKLQGLSFFLVFLFSILLSLAAVRWKVLQAPLHKILYIFISAPSLLWIPLLVYFFSLKLNLLPMRFEPEMKGWILPLIALMIRPLSLATQILLTELKKTEKQTYFLVARAKGLSVFETFFRHGLKNSLIPFSTQMGSFFISAMMGSVLVENLFSFPGMGTLFVESLKSRDLPVVLYLTIIFTFVIVVVQMFVEILHRYLEPRGSQIA